MSRRTHIPCWEYSLSGWNCWADPASYKCRSHMGRQAALQNCRPWHPRLKREVCAADFTAWQGHQFPFLLGHFFPLFGHFMFTAALTRGRAVRQFHPDGGVACLPTGTGLLLTSCYPNDEDERKRDQAGICKRV